MYDIRHNSACYWFNRYPTHKGLMYRFGWRKADKIEYYSEFLGVADEIKDSDMILGEDKTKLYKLEEEIKLLKSPEYLNKMFDNYLEDKLKSVVMMTGKKFLQKRPNSRTAKAIMKK